MKTKNIKINIPEGYDDVKFNEQTNEIEFIKKDNKPRSWEEYCKQKQNTDCFGVFLTNSLGTVLRGNRTTMPHVNEFNTKEEAEAVLALCKLIQLRDSWWGDWRPDWHATTPKYGICSGHNGIGTSQWHNYNRILVFPTAEMRDDFFETFRDLIEEAKMLL